MNKTLRRAEQGYTYSGESDLTVMQCPSCGVTYAIPAALQRNAYERGERAIVWFCPNGHELGYNGPSEDEKARLKAERQARWAQDRAARLAAERDQARADARAQKARGTRFKNDRDRERRRAAAGVCPCCNRTFQNLARHMRSQHPDHATTNDDT